MIGKTISLYKSLVTLVGVGLGKYTKPMPLNSREGVNQKKRLASRSTCFTDPIGDIIFIG